LNFGLKFCFLIFNFCIFEANGVDFFSIFSYSNRTKKEIYKNVGSRIGDYKLTYCYCQISKRDTSYQNVKIPLEHKIKKIASFNYLKDGFLLLKLLKSMYVFDLKYYVQLLIMKNIKKSKFTQSRFLMRNTLCVY